MVVLFLSCRGIGDLVVNFFWALLMGVWWVGFLFDLCVGIVVG